jgi:hypothetical protein
LVQVFNEASWNLDLQPDRTDDQVESKFGPVLCETNGSREADQRPVGCFGALAR